MPLTFYKRKKVFLKDYASSLQYTMLELQELEKSSLNDKNFLIFIRSTFYGVLPEDMPEAVWNFIRKNISYRNDLYDETFISPNKILGLKYGDCDDMSLLAKTILNACGIEAHYMLLAVNPGEFTHILTITNGVLIDATNNVFNQFPPKYNFFKII